MNNYNVPESAIDALDEHTSSDDGVSDRDIQRVADFIELRLMQLPEYGKPNEYHYKARELFSHMVIDHMCDFDVPLCRLSLTHSDEAGAELNRLSRTWIRKIAEDYFDEFADEARNLGWLK